MSRFRGRPLPAVLYWRDSEAPFELIEKILLAAVPHGQCDRFNLHPRANFGRGVLQSQVDDMLVDGHADLAPKQRA